jgi:hypothetical protein
MEDVELWKLSKKQCKRIAYMMFKDRTPVEMEKAVEIALLEPMYVESPMEEWRGMTKDERIKYMKSSAPMDLPVWQAGKVIFLR